MEKSLKLVLIGSSLELEELQGLLHVSNEAHQPKERPIGIILVESAVEICPDISHIFKDLRFMAKKFTAHRLASAVRFRQIRESGQTRISKLSGRHRPRPQIQAKRGQR